jgi:hypothetical protein
MRQGWLSWVREEAETYPNPKKILPDYWLRRPKVALNLSTRRAFDQLLQPLLATNGNLLIDYRLPAPRWQFLCYAAE